MAVSTVQHTNAPRAGRRFQPTHEVALHEVALAACESLPGAHRGVHVIREMAGPIGIPDFTALVGNPKRLAARLEVDVPPVTHQIDVAIVSHAHAKVSRSSKAIAKELGWSVDTVSRRVPGLVQVGALIEVGKDRYVRPADLLPVGRLYAIEAKMSDRTGAVKQGRAYAAWADSYVLVMGRIGERQLAMLTSEVELDKAGLMVDNRWIRRPLLNSLSKVRRLWSSEHFVAAVRPDYYQPSVAP